MNTFSGNKKAKKPLIIPEFFPTQSITIGHIPHEPDFEPFEIFQEKFGHLSEGDLLKKLKSHLIVCDIEQELASMTPNSMLEITVPVLGIADLLQSPAFNSAPKMASVVAINGFGADNKNSAQSYPRADYVNVTDIVGNKFEIFVDEEGQIELPNEGTGLFSVISAVTFIYNEGQVKHGNGLSKIAELQDGKLYLYPPMDSRLNFSAKIAVSHLTSSHKRIVDSIRSIDVHYKTPDNLEEPYQVSHKIRTMLAKKLYSEKAFIKKYLENEGLYLARVNGYNDFLLRPEAFSAFHGILVESLVNAEREKVDQAEVNALHIDQVMDFSSIEDYAKVEETKNESTNDWVERGNVIEKQYQEEKRNRLKSKPSESWEEKEPTKNIPVDKRNKPGKDEGPRLPLDDHLH